jgi:hypothetical protein
MQGSESQWFPVTCHGTRGGGRNVTIFAVYVSGVARTMTKAVMIVNDA